MCTNFTIKTLTFFHSEFIFQNNHHTYEKKLIYRHRTCIALLNRQPSAKRQFKPPRCCVVVFFLSPLHFAFESILPRFDYFQKLHSDCFKFPAIAHLYQVAVDFPAGGGKNEYRPDGQQCVKTETAGSPYDGGCYFCCLGLLS